jgi:hypothetical protein
LSAEEKQRLAQLREGTPPDPRYIATGSANYPLHTGVPLTLANVTFSQVKALFQ